MSARRALAVLGLLAVAGRARAAPGDSRLPRPYARPGEVFQFEAEGPGALQVELRLLLQRGGEIPEGVALEIEDIGIQQGAFVQDTAGRTLRFRLQPRLSAERGPGDTVLSAPVAVLLPLQPGVHVYSLRLGFEARLGALVKASPSALPAMPRPTATPEGGQTPPDSGPPIFDQGPPPHLGPSPPFALDGFVLADFAGRTTGTRLPAAEGGDALVVENRLRAGGQAIAGPAKLVGRGDLVGDAIANDFRADLREGYLDLASGPFELRAGRQLVAWGVGDLLYVNDPFPKDLGSLYAGRPESFVPLGVDAVRLDVDSFVTLELLAIPFFRPDRDPSKDGFFPPGSTLPRREEKPDSGAGEVEAGARLAGLIGPLEVALYGFRGRSAAPSEKPDDPFAPTKVILFHPRIATGGASVRAPLLGGVLFAEAAWRDALDDPDATVSIVPDPSASALAGFRMALPGGALGEVEYRAEKATGGTSRPLHDVGALRLRQPIGAAWDLSLFGYWSPRDRAYLAQPRVSVRTSDRCQVTAGANVFGGDLGPFAGLDRDDDAFLMIRYDF